MDETTAAIERVKAESSQGGEKVAKQQQQQQERSQSFKTESKMATAKRRRELPQGGTVKMEDPKKNVEAQADVKMKDEFPSKVRRRSSEIVAPDSGVSVVALDESKSHTLLELDTSHDSITILEEFSTAPNKRTLLDRLDPSFEESDRGWTSDEESNPDISLLGIFSKKEQGAQEAPNGDIPTEPSSAEELKSTDQEAIASDFRGAPASAVQLAVASAAREAMSIAREAGASTSREVTALTAGEAKPSTSREAMASNFQSKGRRS